MNAPFFLSLFFSVPPGASQLALRPSQLNLGPSQVALRFSQLALGPSQLAPRLNQLVLRLSQRYRFLRGSPSLLGGTPDGIQGPPSWL